jgi:thiamine-phosphate pyrophosphorylase
VTLPFPARGLYAITPEHLGDTALLCAVEQALEGGAAVIQFRDKTRSPESRLEMARHLRTLCHRYQVPLIINDNATLAKTAGADGVHLGRDDGTIQQARKLLGQKAVIGVSCYGDLERAKVAEREGASYVAFGRFFPSHTKPHAERVDRSILKQAKSAIELPLVAIGGITAGNGADLIQAGADLIACVDSVFGDANIENNALGLQKLFLNS